MLNFVSMTGNILGRLQKERYFLYRPPVCYTYTKPVLERMLRSHGFTVERAFRDMRYLHVEKIATLLRWRRLLSLARCVRLHRAPFKVYAYPSKVVVARAMKT